MLHDGNEEISTIPGFKQIQFEGFCRFINQGLIEEFHKFPKIKDPDQEMQFELFAEKYQLVEPLIKERDAVYESLTYSSELYVSAGLSWKTSRHMQEQTVLMGNIPLMSSLGTFIVNGIHRIVINQILQSPGIYYRSELDHNGIPISSCTIISDWGGRLEFEIDGKERIWARVSRKQKISIFVLLSAMGSNLREILDNVCYPEIFLSFPNDEEFRSKENDEEIRSKENDEEIGSKENAILKFYQQLTCVDSDSVFSESLYKELQKKFFQQKCELGGIGRRNMNRRLNLDIPQNNTFLLPRDVLAAVDHLIEMKFAMGIPDDMNHLKNKRIRSVADLLQDQFGLALVRLEHVVLRTISEAIQDKSIQDKSILTPRNLVTGTLLTTTYESFFSLHPLSQVLDRTNPLTHSFHGRKLSYLGPGGLTGRTASFRVRDIHPSHYARICPIDTSEGINVGLIGSLAIHARIGHWGSIETPFYEISEGQMLYFSPSRDEYCIITAGNSLALDWGIQEEQVVPVRYCQEFLTIAWEQIDLRSIFPFQYFSIGASLIPFIEHNDANRALMSSNMQRQAVPLFRSEKCIVGTGLEGQAALDSGVSVIAEDAGKIIYTDTDKMILSNNGKTISIPLVIYQRSNKHTCMHQKPQVPRGKYIKKGQILADGLATVGGELALGKNVLIAYMPWEGYNFEDAVLISERLVYNDIYTSFHIRKYEIETKMTSQGPERITKEIPHLQNRLLRNLDRNGIVMLGAWVESGDILVGKLTPQATNESSYASEDTLLEAILGIEISTTKETSLKLPIGGRGRVIDVRWIQKKNGSRSDYNPEKIRIYILQKREIKVGDKVAGRHGNKGIISKVLPRQDMPYLQDGTPLDMVFSPLGVPSRMNVGQIFECSLGLAGDLLNRHYRIAPFDERYEEEASRKLVLSELYEASKQTSNPWVFEPEYPGKSRIFDGRTGDSFEQPVLIGKSYILKLIHQVDDKIHGRSSGPYAVVTQQPVKGRSKRGGQRVGEMEVWALEGYGVAHILQEMLTYKSDHIGVRQKIVGTTIVGGIIPSPQDAPESFHLLVRELRSLALELNHFLVSERNFQINRKEA
nr:RNA polymerase beta subunit [Hydrocharis dubia]UKT60900.1 RNA polymerase beta subunit [Hydrocharis dubia]